MSDVVLIAAVARNGVIGREGGLAFNEPTDQKHFRASTLGLPVVMGRRTWDSLPVRFRPLPGRRNVVVTRNAGLQAAGADVVTSLPDALALLADAPRVMVIGGAQLYVAAMPLATELLLTEIDADLPGDVHFPAWDRSKFQLVESQPHVTAGGLNYAFNRYRRKG